MIEIEVFADIVCPFAHVGLARWVAERDRRGRPDVRLRVRAWPLELVNGAPMDPAMVAHKVADLRRQVAPALFDRFDPATFPTSSLDGLALTNAAYRRDVATGEAVALQLRRLLFDEGRDVSAAPVLAAVAAEHGLGPDPITPDDRAAVLDDHRTGVARGVVGSPYFFTPGGTGMFCPSLDIERRGDELHVAFDETHLDELIAACFA